MGVKVRSGGRRGRRGGAPPSGSQAGIPIEGSVTREVSLLEPLIYSYTLRPRVPDGVGTAVQGHRAAQPHLDVTSSSRVFAYLPPRHFDFRFLFLKPSVVPPRLFRLLSSLPPPALPPYSLSFSPSWRGAGFNGRKTGKGVVVSVRWSHANTRHSVDWCVMVKVMVPGCAFVR